jgi:hypothetical protein
MSSAERKFVNNFPSNDPQNTHLLPKEQHSVLAGVTHTWQVGLSGQCTDMQQQQRLWEVASRDTWLISTTWSMLPLQISTCTFTITINFVASCEVNRCCSRIGDVSLNENFPYPEEAVRLSAWSVPWRKRSLCDITDYMAPVLSQNLFVEWFYSLNCLKVTFLGCCTT